MNIYTAAMINGDLEYVILLNDYKESLKVNIEAERAMFESTNKVPNGLFWAVSYYNFTRGTDQTTWAIFNNKWYGWLECAQAREAAVAQLGEE